MVGYRRVCIMVYVVLEAQVLGYICKSFEKAACYY